jgi:hypothetical protein
MPRSHLRSLISEARVIFDRMGYLPERIMVQLSRDGINGAQLANTWMMETA